jgi:hypothetical protein
MKHRETQVVATCVPRRPSNPQLMSHIAKWILTVCACASACAVAQTPVPIADPQALVRETVQNELRGNEHDSSFMRYKLHKENTSSVSDRDMVETKEGLIARTLTWNGRELTAQENAKEDEKLRKLATDPQEKAKKLRQQQDDEQRVLRMLRALPDACLYEYDGPDVVNGRAAVRLAFRPNPRYSSSVKEAFVFRAATGKLWIDSAAHRIVRLEGALTDDIYIGWGFLGFIRKGGTLHLEQAMVAGANWRITVLNIDATGRAFLFKTLRIKQHQSGSDYREVPAMSVADAVKLLTSKG